MIDAIHLTPEQHQANVDRLIIGQAYKSLSDLIESCMDANGHPKAPNKHDLMKARAALPPRFKHALSKVR